MEEADHDHGRWLSITGQPLKLDSLAGVKGTSRHLPSPQGDLLLLGRCVSVSSFEKLNQLGEGSMFLTAHLTSHGLTS